MTFNAYISIFLKIYFYFTYVCMCVGEYVHVGAVALGDQKMGPDPLELKLQGVSCPV